MTFSAFLRDQWRVIAFFLAGTGLLWLVCWFAALEQGVVLHWQLVLYSLLLALFALLMYVLVEYLLRRPFYQDMRARLQDELSLQSGDVPLRAVTHEQRRFNELLKRYQTAYSAQIAALEERQNFFETFTVRFVHQMKTPVTVLQLLEQELRQGPGDQRPDDQRREITKAQLDTLDEECRRLEASINAMLHTSRLNAFSFDARMERLDVVKLIRDVVNHHKSAWIRRKLYPRMEAPPHPVWVVSDGKWLSFMVDQIIRNALQYGVKVDEHGQALPSSFEIRVSEEQHTVRLAFRDEGIGIPERDIRHVFLPFYTGENGRTHSRATGMGLYLVKEAADRLGHEVEVSSEVGRGTTVVFRIHAADYYRPAMTGKAVKEGGGKTE
ncbi:MAG: sensor histidine kinase [Alicyclobacillus macrosporangiidus]|uniref:sensor histidine kinase n=1 Tax=Alicyclobacillus macrosporangiidus TaxID=392015 RepID=UPI0026EED30A|nr:sensor histidine kinase [Alicyclobacillus macrosporangiidus]MCL6597695.1 sensor histidine kinase [Alicyclobacillus macrosporangiidus]